MAPDEHKNFELGYVWYQRDTDGEAIMLSGMNSNSLPSPVISWKDKIVSVGGDKKDKD